MTSTADLSSDPSSDLLSDPTSPSNSDAKAESVQDTHSDDIPSSDNSDSPDVRQTIHPKIGRNIRSNAGANIHKGPPLGVLAILFMILFNLGLASVISFSAQGAHFPGPWESAEVIVAYFQAHARDVLWCAFFQFGASIPLLIYAATVSSRLRFLGIQAAGTQIALLGGTLTAVNLGLSALLEWVMAYHGIAQDPAIVRALYYVVFAIGGVGYSVPLGLLIAGIAVTSYFGRLLPTWLVISGGVLALVGELSCVSLIVPQALFLIPLTRFPGFLWLIAAGFLLPRARQRRH